MGEGRLGSEDPAHRVAVRGQAEWAVRDRVHGAGRLGYRFGGRRQLGEGGSEIKRGAVTLDLLEEVGNVLVVKGEGAAQQRIEDDAAAPHVHLGVG